MDKEFIPEVDMDEEEPLILNLELEDGKEVACEVIGIFEVEGVEYIAVVPEDDDQVLIYKYTENDDESEVELDQIEDDEEFDKVTAAFWEIFGEEDFEKEEE
ncbi:MAG: DUF1292 domain-containing protein [Filifactoraceae bacterium]